MDSNVKGEAMGGVARTLEFTDKRERDGGARVKMVKTFLRIDYISLHS